MTQYDSIISGDAAVGENKKICILSKENMEKLSPFFKPVHVIISICEPNEISIFNYNKNRSNILRVTFMDIDKCINNSDVVFNTKIAEKVVHFCNKYKNTNIYFYIHCTAGISRSAGLGAAISKYYNNDDSWFFKYKVPNRLVYRKTLEAFYSIFG